ncbi:TLC domain-containing protein 4-B-like isoform X1 [Centropristis striata]|uniref:TLC domain-containing protein 4-B-like isoform X1 n=1 Tax=Centropristis striata TaxID=184440 RepID=UPI0027E198A3|nr:TLC domain-containing protein 4-B-like isoform X1 [Centropristis striata]XP_059182569.1 TLC domain-containing protein 4-B-like isoform X1 [Centropristis striata]
MDPFSQLILTISVTSFFTFQWLFHKVSPWMSIRISPGFLNLSDKQKVEWNSRTVSTFHALLVGLFCLYILFFDDAVNEDPVWGDPTLVKTNVAITTGYLISDLLLIFYYWKAIGDKFFVVHHLAALYAYYYVLGQGMLPYFANFRLLAEFSTPCVNQRYVPGDYRYMSDVVLIVMNFNYMKVIPYFLHVVFVFRLSDSKSFVSIICSYEASFFKVNGIIMVKQENPAPCCWKAVLTIYLNQHLGFKWTFVHYFAVVIIKRFVNCVELSGDVNVMQKQNNTSHQIF